MKCIVGLGNPGPKYEGTRHNVGFLVINELAKRLDARVTGAKFNSLYGKAEYQGEKLLLVQPTTYMNNSGIAVRAVLDYYRIPVDNLLVVYDDMDFSVGEMRFRYKGSAGGHNGMKSIIEHLKSQDFPRLRIGIGSPERGAIDWVLGKFSVEELKIIDRVVAEAVEGIQCFLSDGINLAMNRYNKNVNNNEEESALP